MFLSAVFASLREKFSPAETQRPQRKLRGITEIYTYDIILMFEGHRFALPDICSPNKPASMVNYYDILKVSPKASKAEIKSAYRRLARKLHPDSHTGSEETALKFAAIAEAYEILGNSKERAKYDQRILQQQYNGNGNADSVFASSNRHAQRWRQMVYEKRYNDIIDRMIEEERSEATAFQKVVYPLVALLVSSIIAAAFRPSIFINAAVVIKIIIVALFIVGVIHLVKRIRQGFERYTEYDDNIHDSILDDHERRTGRYSQYTVAAGLLIGFLACLGVGFLIGTQILPDRDLTPEFLFYPPIITLFVDLMHTFASRLER